MRRLTICALICALALLTNGCNFFGNSGSSSPSTSEPTDSGNNTPPTGGGDSSPSAYGYFVDNFVSGLSYECTPSGLTGTTDSEGRYGYKDRDTVTFKAGEIELGSCPASEYVTPMTLFPDDDELALNVAQLLQSMDSDGNPENGITPDPDALEALRGINIRGNNFEADLQANLPAGLTFVNRENAMNHIEDTFINYGINPNGSHHSVSKLFVGGDEEHGFEIWKTENGRTFEFLKDLSDGNTYGSLPDKIVKMGSKIFFVASTGQYGEELWVTDGTATGTKLVKDIEPGIDSSSPTYLTVVGNVLYFKARTSETGNELWKSDGTEAGTVLVKDIKTGADSSSPANLIAYNSKLYFTASTSAEGIELWTSNGTEAGTTLLKDFYSGTESSFPSDMSVADGHLWFKAHDGMHYHLVKSNGTTAGTVSVDDTVKETSNLAVFDNKIYYFSDDHLKNANNSSVVDLIAFTNGQTLYPGETKIYFTEGAPNQGRLSVTNGINTIDAVNDDNDDQIYTTSSGIVVNDQFLFAYNMGTDNVGTELWKAAGNTATLIKDIRTGINSSEISNLTAMGTKAVFSAITDDQGNEPWVTDGTSAGTKMLKDIAEDGNSQSTNYYSIDGKVYFSANDTNSGQEMWVTDGTTTGTKMFADINTVPTSGIDPSASVFKLGNNYVFDANDDTLWISDGTAAGTVATEYSAVYLRTAVPFGDSIVYVTRNDDGSQYMLIKTDGTIAGTQILETFRHISRNTLTVSGDKIYFDGQATSADTQAIYVTDGMQAAARILRDSNNDLITDIESLSKAGDEKVAIASKSFNIGSDDYTVRLYFSDGTPEGTHIVKENTGEYSEEYLNNLAYVNGEIFFASVDTGTGNELWSSDGTIAGTVLVKEITGSTRANSIESLVNVNGTLYFILIDDNRFGDLWKSDGTPEGTTIVMNTEATRVSRSRGISPLAVVDNQFYFITVDDSDNQEAWVLHTNNNLLQKVDLGNIDLSEYAIGASYKKVDGIYRDSEYVLFWLVNASTRHLVLKKVIGSSSKTITDFYYYEESSS